MKFNLYHIMLASLPFTAASQSPVAAPPGFNITSIGLNGSGCPPGSATYQLSTDRQSIAVALTKFRTEVGPNVPYDLSRRNCQITLGIRVPEGYSFTIGSIEYRGHYQLDRGVTGSQNTIYYFQGQIDQVASRSELRGPIDQQPYTYRDLFGGDYIYSPCGRPTLININSDFRVSNSGNRNGSGYITSDVIEGSAENLFFLWKAC